MACANTVRPIPGMGIGIFSRAVTVAAWESGARLVAAAIAATAKRTAPIERTPFGGVKVSALRTRHFISVELNLLRLGFWKEARIEQVAGVALGFIRQ